MERACIDKRRRRDVHDVILVHSLQYVQTCVSRCSPLLVRLHACAHFFALEYATVDESIYHFVQRILFCVRPECVNIRDASDRLCQPPPTTVLFGIQINVIFRQSHNTSG